jgi:hypothetical protein
MTKIKTTNQLAQDILAPLIKHCATNRGALTEVTERFNKGLAEPVRISTIQKWLARDEKKRIEPVGGSLLRLCEVWIAIRQPDVANLKEQSVFCSVNGCRPSRNGEHCLRCGREF